jgi:hypothetical protein
MSQQWNDKGVCTYPRCSCKATGVFCKDKDKKNSKSAPRAIPRVSKKGILRQQDRALMLETDMLFYLEIWSERPHVCFECDGPLGDEPLLQYFHHVLEKGSPRYAHLRHEKMNIVLLDWVHHDSVPANLDKMPKLKEYRNHLLKHFNLD